MAPGNWILRLGMRVWAGPPVPVTHVLQEGDDSAGRDRQAVRTHRRAAIGGM